MIFHWTVTYINSGHVSQKKIYSTVLDLYNRCMDNTIYDYMIIKIEKTDERYV
jgi:pimeloyl-CoA synthetase